MLEELPVPFGLWTWLYRVWWFYRPLEASPSVPTDRTAHTHSHGAKRLLPALEGGQAVQCVGPQDARVRSEERRVGKECVSRCRSRGSPYNQKKKNKRKKNTYKK